MMKIIKTIQEKFITLDKNVKNIMVYGCKFSFSFCIFSAIILLLYNLYAIPVLYYSGIILFKTSLIFFSEFLILGIGFDKIKKQMI